MSHQAGWDGVQIHVERGESAAATLALRSAWGIPRSRWRSCRRRRLLLLGSTLVMQVPHATESRNPDNSQGLLLCRCGALQVQELLLRIWGAGAHQRLAWKAVADIHPGRVCDQTEVGSQQGWGKPSGADRVGNGKVNACLLVRSMSGHSPHGVSSTHGSEERRHVSLICDSTLIGVVIL